MHTYKVVYVESSFLKKKKALAVHNEGQVDGYSLSRDLEALLVDEEKQGYEVFSIVPIASNIGKFGQTLSITRGLMVTLKRKTSTDLPGGRQVRSEVEI